MYTTPNDSNADIIIIGGGISGMSAAYYIWKCEPSLDILVLEANNFVGGRTLTLPLKTSSGMRSYDFGGHLLATSQPFLSNLLQNLNLEVVNRNVDTPDFKIILNLNPKSEQCIPITLSDFIQSSEWFEIINFMKKINTMCQRVTFDEPHTTNYSLRLDYTSMENFLKLNVANPLAQNFIRHIIQVSCGIDASEISVLFYLAYCNATGGMQHQIYLNSADFTWIKGGADQICNKIASLISRECIKTKNIVTEITWDSSQVMIQTENKIYSAKYAILALPPTSILRINFNPPIKENRLNVLKGMKSGNLIKFIITYKSAFWRTFGYSGTIISCGNPAFGKCILRCFDITHNNSPGLCGYLLYNRDEKRASYKDQVLTELCIYFGPNASEPLDYIEKDWLKDKNPYIDACLASVPQLGDMNNYAILKRPLGNLFWAGTEMGSCWNGHMDGAVQAGYRAASEVLYHFRPQNIIFHELPEITRPSVVPDPADFFDILTDWKTILITTSLLTIMLLR